MKLLFFIFVIELIAQSNILKTPYIIKNLLRVLLVNTISSFNILVTFQILRKILLPFIYTYSLFFCFFIFSSRSLRNSKYAGLINIHKNDVISIAKKHENFDFEKQYSKLICSIVVCKQGQYCSSEVCPRLSRKSPRRVRKSITQQVGDSSKESFLIIFSYFLKMLSKT